MNSQDSNDPQASEGRLSRRRVLQWFAAAAAVDGTALPAFGQGPAAAPPATKGYGTDPALNKTYKIGEIWPLLMTPAEKKAAVALADLVLPADDLGPAASEVRVADYLDEWISAPYPRQKGERGVIQKGLKKLDADCQKQFQKNFADLSSDQKTSVCDELAKGDHFFHLFTLTCSGAYYSTQPGWQAIGYLGNLPYGGPFLGPPEEVLKQAGVEQTVK